MTKGTRVRITTKPNQTMDPFWLGKTGTVIEAHESSARVVIDEDTDPRKPLGVCFLLDELTVIDDGKQTSQAED